MRHQAGKSPYFSPFTWAVRGTFMEREGTFMALIRTFVRHPTPKCNVKVEICTDGETESHLWARNPHLWGSAQLHP